MSLATRPPRGATDRLPRSGGPARRGREIRLGLLGVLGIVVLVVGIPAALVLFVGYPLPRSAPSKDWLTQSISATLIIKILACVVWLLWAHFVVCLISEWRSLRRGRLPSNVPFGGGSQLLARRLVAAALLLAGAATAFGTVASSSGRPSPAPVAARHAVELPWANQAGHAQEAGTDRARPSQGDERATDAAARLATRYYVVAPPEGRHYDCLWDIAQRTLGDPLRYKEIFALNKDRTQADGSKLVDANLIRPGWELRLPADAAGPGVHVVHAAAPAKAVQQTEHAEQTQAAGAERAMSAGAAAAPVVRGTEQADHAARFDVSGSAASSFAGAVSRAATGSSSSLDSSLFGGALMLAGVLVALSARRGPYGVPSEDEDALALVADMGLATTLDRVLRNMAAARREQGRPLPEPIVAWASPDEVTLNLAGGDPDEPPAPWQRADDGRSWTCRVSGVVDHPDLADVAAPYPGLVSVGRHEEFELFVDVEQAPGPISVGGDVERGRELVTALAVQAVTSTRSDGARATLVGFGNGADLARIDPRNIVQVSRLDTVLDDLEREQESVLRLQRQLGVDGILTGRQARRSASWRPHLIALSGPPTPDEARRLQDLVGSGRSTFVVISVGDTTGARWRFAIDAAGRLDLGVLGASAHAHRLSRTAMERLVELLSAATRSGRDEARAVAAMTPHQAVAATSSPGSPASLASTASAGGGTAGAPAPRRPLTAPATVSVSLLGPVTVEAPGPIDAAKRDLATEIVVAIALHADGLHDAVLRASIWPRGAGEQVVESALADVAQWLGSGPDGRPCLVCEDGRWLLGDAVRVDWDELRQAAESAAGPEELPALLHGVGLIRGAGCSGTPSGRYAWLAFARAARESRVVATAVVRRAARALAERQRVDEAAQVLRRGLVLVPTAELIWRDLLNLVGQRGPEAVTDVADEMYRTLHRLHAWPESETDALVAQLAPGHRVHGAPSDPKTA